MIIHHSYIRLLFAFLFPISFVSSIEAQCDVTYFTTDNFCFPGDSIYITLDGANGTPPYNYLWSNGETTPTISVLLVPSDVYFTVTDATGCTYSSFIHVKPGPYIAGIGGNYFLCGSESTTLGLFWYRFPPDGVLYEWSTGETTPNIDVSDPGPYSVTVTDPSSGCSLTFDTSVDPGSNPQIEVTSVTPASCGQNSGAINITVTGQYSPFTYDWSNGASTQDISNLAPGNYTVTVTANDGCEATETISVGGGSTITITGSASPNTSCANPNGSISITVSPAGIFTYTWSNGSASEDLTGLTGGTYTITVTSGSGCTATASYTVVNNVSNPNGTASSTAATCDQSNGSINLTVTGGVGPYTFDWSNGSNAEDLSGIAAGPYMVTITGSNGCTQVVSSTVANNNSTVSISGTVVPNSSCVTNNGAVNITIMPAGSYSFDWSNGAITEDITGIVAGVYGVTVTDVNGCTDEASFTVSNMVNNPNGVAVPIAASCGQSNGSINLIVSGGAGPFSFLWSSGQTTEDINQLAAGMYTVTITGSNGCTQSVTTTINNSNPTISITGTAISNSACIGGNGNINIDVSPPGTYTFLWSNGATTEDVQGLQEGVYTVTATNASGCTSITSFAVGSIVNPPSGVISTTPASCGQSNGSINLTITIGMVPFQFLWSTGAISEDLFNISAGAYKVTITDANGCSAELNTTVSNANSTITISGVANSNSSCIIANGSITTSVAPADTYSFLWSTGETTQDINGLPEGTYSVTVTNAEGCNAFATYTVSSVINYPVGSTIVMDAACDQPNGNIDLSMTSGAGPFDFKWSIGSATEDLSNIFAGIYSVTVTDVSGCTSVLSDTVANGSVDINITGLVIPNSSCANENGSIDIVVQPAGNYAFLWSTGSSMEDVNSLSAGTYSVTVTNDIGCTAAQSFTVGSTISSPSGSVFIVNASCGQANGNINLIVTSGLAPYVYRWSNGWTLEDLAGVGAGNYNVTISDANGCTDALSATVSNEILPIGITGVATGNSTCIGSNGSVDIVIIPAGSYDFLWSNSQTTEDISGLASGIYTVTVTDEAGCSSSASFDVDGTSTMFAITSDTFPNTSCSIPNGRIDVTVAPAGQYEYQWSNGLTTEDVASLAAGNYELTVTDDRGCFLTSMFTISTNTTNPEVTGIVSPSICNTPTGAVDLTVSTEGNVYNWSNNVTTEDLVDIIAGDYLVTVTGSNGCITTASFSISDSVNLPVISGMVTDASCGNDNGAIEVSVDQLNINVAWSNGATAQQQSDLAAGAYSITVTNEDGCTSEMSFTVEGSTPLEAVIDADLSSINSNGIVTADLHINIPESALASVTWSPADKMSCKDAICMQQQFTLTASAEITALVTDIFGCTASASVMVDYVAEEQVYIPNVFSPGSGNGNDRFTVFGNVQVEEVVVLQIFNRWGNLVFTKSNFPVNDLSYGWDGVYKGEILNPDVFAYVAVVRLSDGNERRYAGDVTLLR